MTDRRADLERMVDEAIAGGTPFVQPQIAPSVQVQPIVELPKADDAGENKDFENDTPNQWGFATNQGVIPLPKLPMLKAGLGPPPFDVTLPGGQVRHVIEITDQPAATTPQDIERREA
jgi:hypothetical protein